MKKKKKLKMSELVERGMIVAGLLKEIEKHLDKHPEDVRATVIAMLHGKLLAQVPEDMRQQFLDQHSEHARICADNREIIERGASALQRRIQ